MIIIKLVRYVAALIIMAASISVLLCSCLANSEITEQTSSVLSSSTNSEQPSIETTSTQSDKDLIVQKMKKSTLYKDYQLPDQFMMEEPDAVYSKYGSRYYRCTWFDVVDEDKTKNLTVEFLIKNGEAFLIYQLDQVLEVDFDHDGMIELIIHNHFGSGVSTDTYYVIEKEDEPIYYITYWFAWFDKIQNSDYIIRARTNDDRDVFGVLKYKVVDDTKSVYIDAGEDTDKLQIIK